MFKKDKQSLLKDPVFVGSGISFAMLFALAVAGGVAEIKAANSEPVVKACELKGNVFFCK